MSKLEEIRQWVERDDISITDQTREMIRWLVDKLEAERYRSKRKSETIKRLSRGLAPTVCEHGLVKGDCLVCTKPIRDYFPTRSNP